MIFPVLHVSAVYKQKVVSAESTFTVRENATIVAAVEAGQWDKVIDYVNREVFDKPAEYYNLDKLRKAAAVDRRLGLREILEKIFGLIPRFKSKDELLEEEFSKFVADYKPEEAEATALC